MLTASNSTQFAWEGEQVTGETENSLFTHYLVKGWKSERIPMGMEGLRLMSYMTIPMNKS